MARLIQRLDRIASGLPQPHGHDFKLDRLSRDVSRFSVGWELLAPTMDPEHVAIVEAEVPDWWHWLSHRGRAWLTFGRDPEDMGSLMYHVSQMIGNASAGKHRGPFVLPGIVAQVVNDDPLASVIDECSDCGYGVPGHSGWSAVRGGHGGVRIDEPRDYFSKCPLCGHDVGCLLYSRTHGGQSAPTFQLPQDRLDAVYAETLAYFRTVETEHVINDKKGH